MYLQQEHIVQFSSPPGNIQYLTFYDIHMAISNNVDHSRWVLINMDSSFIQVVMTGTDSIERKLDGNYINFDPLFQRWWIDATFIELVYNAMNVYDSFMECDRNFDVWPTLTCDRNFDGNCRGNLDANVIKAVMKVAQYWSQGWSTLINIDQRSSIFQHLHTVPTLASYDREVCPRYSSIIGLEDDR